MTEDEFKALACEIVTEAQAEAIYLKLTPFLNQVDDLVFSAQFAYDQWLAGVLTRMNGITGLEKALNSIEA